MIAELKPQDPRYKEWFLMFKTHKLWVKRTTCTMAVPNMHLMQDHLKHLQHTTIRELSAPLLHESMCIFYTCL